MAGFLDLPGEIRNRIYALLSSQRLVVLRRRSKQKRTASPADKPKFGCSDKTSPLYAILPSVSGQHDWPLLFPPRLLRVCRKIHNETIPLLYARTTFQFESSKIINLFLSRASSVGMKQIRSLVINKSGYGEPHMTEDTGWKVKHDRRWLSTCKRLVAAMPRIQHLQLNLQICDWPCQLNLSAKWAQPLYHLKGQEGLERVDIHLTSPRFDVKRLAAAAHMVEKAMMSERGWAQRQLECDLQQIAHLEERDTAARKLIGTLPENIHSDQVSCVAPVPPIVKACRILSIKMEGSNSTQKVPAAFPVSRSIAPKEYR